MHPYGVSALGPYSFSYFRLLFFVSPHMLMVGNLCSYPCCLATFSNTFHGFNNCQLLALVQLLTVLQPASLILLAFPAWFPDACCSPCHSLLLHSRQEEGERGKGRASTFIHISLAGIFLWLLLGLEKWPFELFESLQ